MNILLDDGLSGTGLEDEERGVLKEFILALKDRPEMEIKSVILYGSAASQTYRPGRSDVNLLFLVDRIDLPVLRGLVDHVARGRRGNLAPFFLTEDDVAATVDIFPLKYMAMKNRYRLLYGKDFLADIEVKTDYALLRVRQRLMNMLLRMRRHYLVNNGQRLTAMMSQQIKRFIETLGILLALKGDRYENDEEVMEASALAFDLNVEMLRRLYTLREADAALPGEHAEILYGQFLEIVRQVSERATALKNA